MQKNYFVLYLILISFGALAQNHYLVEFESFSPPEKDLISSLKGFPAEAFLAKDAEGREHFLNDYRGKTVLLHFYSVVDDPSFRWVSQLNLIQIQYIDDLQIFGFADEERSIIESAMKDQAIVYPNFPNGNKFGEMAYAGDLGLGRMILINEDGIISEVIPRSWIEKKNNEEAMAQIDKILSSMIHGK